MKKNILRTLFILLLVGIGSYFFYFGNTYLANPTTRAYYAALKDSLRSKGYSSNLLVYSTRRVRWQNKLIGAASKSKHLDGLAIDFIVFDINKDGKANSVDVDIVYAILDKSIIKNKGGLGTYKNKQDFFSRQMIHIDCRGYRARWAR